MTLDQYVDNINKRFKLGNATEHTFRGDLQQLIENLVPTIRATNEPKRQSCGAPDYILTIKDIPVGFIEAKDIGDKDLEGLKKTGNKEQFDRYKASLDNLIFTDYLNFYVYRNGQFVSKVSIAEITSKGISPLSENFGSFENFIKDFCSHVGQTIKSTKRLAEMMAGKARLLSEVIERALTSDETNQEDSTLKDQMNAFRKILIHDITPKGFADVYAQTITYGMFAARLHDPTLPTFSRQEAFELIPKSNPFLKKLFGYIAGLELDERIKWIVDDLVTIFLACNVEEMLKSYGKATKMEDPIIHFYEDFLSEYDPSLRKARGVWYTPQPVVNFIVRAVDDILKTEFGLPQGLADTSKTKIKITQQGKEIEKEVHNVQVLDPATGTGTFLAEVIKHIHKKFEGQQGIWSNYVETHLLPRLNGFELLMASYAMAHLKLDLLLTETGYKPTTNQRFRVYLTNSLEESHPDTGTLFANWLSTEANEANHIKRDTPVMCVIGNPPYSGISSNNNEWISKLIEDYKYVDGVHFNERKHWLNDDYVKFLRYGQYFIEKNGSGVLAFINPHGFLDNPTFRGMRWHLLTTYDKIYTVDLHGNSNKKEVSPDGGPDINVFDIQQGVSINIFIKTNTKKNELAQVFTYDLYGKREVKYTILSNSNFYELKFEELKPSKPDFLFKKVNLETRGQYNSYLSIQDLFIVKNSGIQTSRDDLAISLSEKELIQNLNFFHNQNNSDETVRSYFFSKGKRSLKYINGDTRGWKMSDARKRSMSNFSELNIRKVYFRPFDKRAIYYSDDIVDWRRFDVMKHMLSPNLCLNVHRSVMNKEFAHVSVSEDLVDLHSLDSALGSFHFPLYLYSSSTIQRDSNKNETRIPNVKIESVNQFVDKLGLTFTNEKEITKDTFAPIDILDYIYAVLHSPTYREKYKEFLKIDFPRVPYPKDKYKFWELVKLGGDIRQIHLLESPIVEKFITQYPIDGDNVVSKVKFEENYEIIDGDKITHADPVYSMGRVYINEHQFFQQVPKVAWEFYIGGYQPAQKWLKDRKERKLEYEDILHYQKIIVALSETARLMKEIEKVEIE